MLKEIVVRCTEKAKKTGEKFPVYKARKAEGTWDAMKFTRDVRNAPVKPGLYTLTIDTENMNKSYSDFGTVWWVKKVENVIEFMPPDEASEVF